MSNDLFVWWRNKDKQPTREEVGMVIEDFFGEALKESVWSWDRFMVTLQGKWSHPLRRVLPPEMLHVAQHPSPDDPSWEGRHMEVWLGKDALDVITRQQDSFTCFCQRALAQVLGRFWDGKVED